MKYELDLLVTVARMYYLDGLKQDEIAKRLSVSRPLISLMLAEAKDAGIVDIRVLDPREDNAELSNLLRSSFGLKAAHVVPTASTEAEVRRDLAVMRAIDVFNQVVKRDDSVGISWGSTIYEFMSRFESTSTPENVSVLPLVGSTQRSLKRYQMNEVVREFAEKLRGTAHFIHAPALPATVRDFELYHESSELRSIVGHWKQIDIALFSIAAPPAHYSDELSESIDRGDRQTADFAARAIGDICGRFFDNEGRFLETEIASRTIAIPVESLRTAKEKICVASGDYKVVSLLAGLKTGLVDTFITDETTAQAVAEHLTKS